MDVVTRTLTASLEALRSRLENSLDVSCPEAEFVRFVFESADSPIPFELPKLSPNLEHLRLGRAPGLAAAGYRLGAYGKHSSIAQAWRDGFERLMGTEPFPHDRISFAYRPIDLIGLAVGVEFLNLEGGTSWLRHVVRQRVEDERPTKWPEVLYLIAADTIGLTANTSAVATQYRSVDELPLLAFVSWWVARSGERESPRVARQLEEALLNHLLLIGASDLDVPLSAMVLQAAEVAVKRRVAWFVSASESGVANSSGTLGVLIGVLRRFHVAVQQLRRRYASREPFSMNDEYDVQDLLHAVLKLHFDDVRPEEWTPSYGGRSSRMDFLLKPEHTVVEVKMTRERLGQKEVTQELAIDREHYRAHPDCETLVCFVYDPEGRCTNPMALESDLSRSDDGFKVFVVVAPVGT